MDKNDEKRKETNLRVQCCNEVKSMVEKEELPIELPKL